MAIALRQAYSTYPSNSQTSVSVISGDLIIVGYSYNDTPKTIVCSDNATGGSNAYSQLGTGQGNGSVTSVTATGHVFYAVAKNTETITVTLTAETDNGLSVHVVSGLNSNIATILDSYQSDFLNRNAIQTTANITTTTPNEYLFVYWFQEDSTRNPTDNGTGFTLETNQNGHIHQTFDKIVSTIGTYNNSITIGSPGIQYYGYIFAAFNVSAVVLSPTITGVSSITGINTVTF